MLKIKTHWPTKEERSEYIKQHGVLSYISYLDILADKSRKEIKRVYWYNQVLVGLVFIVSVGAILCLSN